MASKYQIQKIYNLDSVNVGLDNHFLIRNQITINSKYQNKLLKKVATKTELKREIQQDIAKYEKAYKKQTKAFLRFIESIKKLDK